MGYQCVKMVSVSLDFGIPGAPSVENALVYIETLKKTLDRVCKTPEVTGDRLYLTTWLILFYFQN